MYSQPLPSNRSFAITFSVFFLCLATLTFGFKDSKQALLFLGISSVFALFAVTKPDLLKPFNILWTKFGLYLHRITTPIIMGVVFFLVVTPIALLMRILNARPLSLQFEQTDSYWVDKQKNNEFKSMKYQF